MSHHFCPWTNFIWAPGAKKAPCSILPFCISSHRGWELERKDGVAASHDIQLHIHSALMLGQWPIFLITAWSCKPKSLGAVSFLGGTRYWRYQPRCHVLMPDHRHRVRLNLVRLSSQTWQTRNSSACRQHMGSFLWIHTGNTLPGRTHFSQAISKRVPQEKAVVKGRTSTSSP